MDEPAAIAEREESAVVRVEANVEELPIFSATKGARRDEVVTWERPGRDPASGKPVSQKMTLRPAAGLGLPATAERDLYYLVLAPWIEERRGFGEGGRIGPISYREACRRLGKSISGRSYDQLRQSIETLASMTVKFEYCIVDGKTRTLGRIVDRWFSAAFYEEAEAKHADAEGEDYELKRGEFLLRAAEWFIRSYEANYLKPIDTGVYRKLKEGISKALYSYLDKRGWDARRKRYRDEVVEDLVELRERFRLSVRETKKLLQLFRRAHEDLVANWPALQDARIEKLSPGRYVAVYTFSMQTRLPFSEPEGDEGESGGEELLELLVSRGVAPGVAAKLARKYPPETIERQVDIHDEELEHGREPIKNPGGRLHKRILEDWPPFEGYDPPEKRAERAEFRRRAEAEERGKLEAMQREEERWEALSPEEKAKERLGIWLIIQRDLHKREPSEAEQREKFEELVTEFERK